MPAFEAVRRLARIVTGGLILKRRLPAAFGHAPLYVAPESQLKYLKPGSGGFDPHLLTMAEEAIKPGMTVWDIGANVGVFTIAAANRATGSRVLAVEPDEWLVRLLRRSAALPGNRRHSITVLHAAIADRNGVARLQISSRGRASSSLDLSGVVAPAAPVREEQVVTTLTLDTLLESEPAPDFVKIDVEGAELLVLSGAERLLAKVRPVLYVEVHPSNREAATAVLKRHAYDLFDGRLPRQQRRALDQCVFDTLALPRPLAP